jgi:quercetin dioxygenase-like cupin family protein
MGAGRERVLGPSEGRHLSVLGDDVRILATARDTAGAYEVFELDAPAESGPPVHQHPWNEAYLVMAGELAVKVGDREFNAGPGSFFNVPGGVWHGYRVLTPQARILIVSERGSVSEFFTEIAHEISMPPDFGRVLEIAARHEVTAAPPPA